MLLYTLIALSLIISTGLPCQAEVPSLDKWQVLNAQSFEHTGSRVKIKTSQKGAYLVSPPVALNAERIDTMVLKIRSDMAGPAGVYWINSYSHDYNQQKSVNFDLKRSDSYQTYIFNLKKRNPNWVGFTSQVLIAMPPEIGEVEISEVKLITSNFGTNLMSGLQEFTGSKGRTIIGSSINNFKSSSILGISIYQITYFIILAGVFLLVIIQFRTGFSKKNYAVFVAKSFVLLFAMWALLDLNTLFNEFGIFRSEFKYAGRSLDEKRALISPEQENLYPFLKFCNEKLPQGVPIKIYFDIDAYSSLIAYYNLYPHEVNDDAEYVVVYHFKEKILEKDAVIFAKFKDNEYILKRKKQ